MAKKKRKHVDLTGRKFGKWTVLRPATSKYKKRTYHCRCACGFEAVRVGSLLKVGRTKQCRKCADAARGLLPPDEWEGRRYAVEPNGCWIWRLRLHPISGYAIVFNGRHGCYARHILYEHHIGKIRPGWILESTCGNAACVNPDHLKLTQHRANYGEAVVPKNGPYYIVDKATSCWVWLKAVNNKGAPITTRRFEEAGGTFRNMNCIASRAIFSDHRDLPAGTVLLRTCDNKRCVNPAHHQAVASHKEAHKLLLKLKAKKEKRRA